MAYLERLMQIPAWACFVVIIGIVDCFMNGAPNYSCRDPSTFHTRRINDTHEGIILPQNMSTNPFVLEVDATTFAPGDKLNVTLHSGSSGLEFKGFFIQAIQGNVDIRDLARQAFGTFQNTTKNERPSICRLVQFDGLGGITHANNDTKISIKVVWTAPESINPVRIQFLATAVYNYDTYWTNIRTNVLTAVKYPPVKSADGKSYFPTATDQWVKWLRNQRIQQMRLLSQQEAARTTTDHAHSGHAR